MVQLPLETLGCRSHAEKWLRQRISIAHATSRISWVFIFLMENRAYYYQYNSPPCRNM